MISHTNQFQVDPMLEEVIDDKIIKSLVYVELKVKQIRESSNRPTEQFICRSINDLLETNGENLLIYADQYPKEQKWPLTLPSSIQEEIKKEVAERKPHWLILDTFLCIEMVRFVILYVNTIICDHF